MTTIEAKPIGSTGPFLTQYSLIPGPNWRERAA